MPFLIRLAIAWAINAAALWVADALWDGVTINGWAAFLIGSAVLGIANTLIKPMLALLTLPLILVTLGLFYLLINIAMVALAEWIAPDFSIDGFWSYVGSVIVVWAVNWVADMLLERPRLTRADSGSAAYPARLRCRRARRRSGARRSSARGRPRSPTGSARRPLRAVHALDAVRGGRSSSATWPSAPVRSSALTSMCAASHGASSPR